MNDDNYTRSTLFLGRMKKNPMEGHPKRNLLFSLIISTAFSMGFFVASWLINTFTIITTPIVFIFFTIPIVEGILVGLSFGLYFDAINSNKKFSTSKILSSSFLINLATFAITLILLIVLNIII